MTKYLKCTLYFMFLSLRALAAPPDRLDVQALQDHLLKSQASWKAGSNHLTEGTLTQFHKTLLHAKKSYFASYFRDGFVSSSFSDTNTGEIFDWRDYKGQNWIGPAENQGMVSSCLVFSFLGAMEAQTTINSGLSWLRPELSKQAMVSCSNNGNGLWYGDDAIEIAPATEYLNKIGVPDKACAPYISGVTGTIPSCREVLCADAGARTMKSDAKVYNGIDEMKAAVKKGPIVGVINSYDDFEAYKSGIYKHTSTTYYELHAVLIVGFNDPERYWIVRNSWGQDWGEKGFARISYDAGIELTYGVGFSPIASAPSEVVAFKGLNDHDYLGEGGMIKGVSTYQKADRLRLILKSEGQEKFSTDCASSQDCNIAMTSNRLSDGRYEAILQTQIGDQVLGVSEPKYFFFAAHAPTGTDVHMENVNGRRLENSVLSGDSGLNFWFSSQPVAFNQVLFRVFHNGKEVRTIDYSKRYFTDHVSYNWSTLMSEDGAYTLRLEGRLITGGKVLFEKVKEYHVTLNNGKPTLSVPDESHMITCKSTMASGFFGSSSDEFGVFQYDTTTGRAWLTVDSKEIPIFDQTHESGLISKEFGFNTQIYPGSDFQQIVFKNQNATTLGSLIFYLDVSQAGGQTRIPDHGILIGRYLKFGKTGRVNLSQCAGAL